MPSGRRGPSKSLAPRFGGVWLITRNAHARSNLQSERAGVDYVRVLGSGGGASWEAQPIPAWQ